MRSDVWSTGLTLLELAQNRPPYPNEFNENNSIIALLGQITHGDVRVHSFSYVFDSL